MEYRNRYNALLAAYCLDSELRLGIHVVPLDFPIPDKVLVVLCPPSSCRCFHDLRRKALSFDLIFVVVLPFDLLMVLFFDVAISLRKASRRRFIV